MAVGGEAMLLDTTSGFEQPDAVRSPLSPLGEGERTPSAIACVQRLRRQPSGIQLAELAKKDRTPPPEESQKSTAGAEEGGKCPGLMPLDFLLSVIRHPKTPAALNELQAFAMSFFVAP